MTLTLAELKRINTAYMAASIGRGVRLEQRFIGRYTDTHGLRWEVWESCSMRLSAMVRLVPIEGENLRKKCRYVYDPSSRWRYTAVQEGLLG